MVEKKKVNDEKLKGVRPTLREKKRFMLLEITSEKPFDFKTLSDSLYKELTFLLGSLKVGESGFWFIKDKFDEKKQRAVVKVGVKFDKEFRGAIALISELDKRKCKVEVKRVSGTLKGLEKEN